MFDDTPKQLSAQYKAQTPTVLVAPPLIAASPSPELKAADRPDFEPTSDEMIVLCMYRLVARARAEGLLTTAERALIAGARETFEELAGVCKDILNPKANKAGAQAVAARSKAAPQAPTSAEANILGSGPPPDPAIQPARPGAGAASASRKTSRSTKS